jgi:hypothetical protein
MVAAMRWSAGTEKSRSRRQKRNLARALESPQAARRRPEASAVGRPALRLATSF